MSKNKTNSAAAPENGNWEKLRQQHIEKIKKECPDLAGRHQNAYPTMPADTSDDNYIAGVEHLADYCSD